ncbi:MAG: glycosyltransferase [Pseudomonadota bacterium]
MTRFNLATPGRELSIRTKPGWLNERFELFEKYCLPAMAAQTSDKFHWVIYFDKDTPDAFKDRIERLRQDVPFTPYYTGLFDGDGWSRSLHELFAPTDGMILTTRLDNDDSLSCDFIERLHAAIEAQGLAPGAYNFRNGVICSHDQLYSISHDSAPFFSWLEPLADTLRTAPNIHHMRIAESGSVFQIDGAPAWMQVIHETNVSNRIRGRRMDPQDIAGMFPAQILEALSTVTPAALAFDHTILSQLRLARDGLAGLLRGSHTRR